MGKGKTIQEHNKEILPTQSQRKSHWAGGFCV